VLTFLDDFDIATGFTLDGVELGGLSGLWIEPETGVGVAVSDGRKEHGPPRFYSLRADVNHGKLTVTPLSHRMYDSGPTPSSMMDAEGIAISRAGEIFISSEGTPRASPPVPPSIVRLSPEGTLRGTLPMPSKLTPSSPESRGVRHNKGLEALSFSPSGRALYTATEHALVQDGPAPTFEHGTRCRLLRFDMTRQPPGLPKEYVYETDAIPRPPGVREVEAKGIGVAEVLALTDERLLILERAGVKVHGQYTNAIKIYEVDVHGAVDVSGQNALPPDAVALDKRLVFELDAISSPLGPELPALDNFEAMSFGPRLADGRRSLILASDNNFKKEQRTAFFAFAISE